MIYLTHLTFIIKVSKQLHIINLKKNIKYELEI